MKENKVLEILNNLESRILDSPDNKFSEIIESSQLSTSEYTFLKNILLELDNNFIKTFEEKVKSINFFSIENIIDYKKIPSNLRSKYLDTLEKVIELEKLGSSGEQIVMLLDKIKNN
jgi:hypothetical protein